MKKYLYLLSLLMTSICLSQTYQFDVLTKYSSKSSTNKHTTDFVNYFNTTNYSYTLSLAKSDSRFVALLLDKSRNLIHYFKVTESKDRGEIKFQFAYEYSLKKSFSTMVKDYHYTFSQPSEFSPNEVTLKIFKSKKSKKPIHEQVLTLQNSEQNLFPIYQAALLAHFPSKQVLPGNYTIIKAVETCSKCSCEITLAENKKISLEIKLPDHLNLL